MKLRIPNPDEYEAQIKYTAAEIDARLDELAAEIDRDYPDGVTLLCYLKAAAILGADLLRKLKAPAKIDYLGLGRLQLEEGETPILFLRQDATLNIYDENVILLTDIVRSGFTMHFLLQQLRAREPKELEILALMHNPNQQLLPLPLKYIGFETDYDSLCGYGMDFKGRGRQFPDIIQLLPDKNDKKDEKKDDSKDAGKERSQDNNSQDAS